jgi:hypothetical protein
VTNLPFLTWDLYCSGIGTSTSSSVLSGNKTFISEDFDVTISDSRES